MNNSIEYIESYFQETLNENEKRSFEKRCEQDEDFAKEVAFYLTTRQALREELLTQKQAEWKEQENHEEELPSIAPAKRSIFRTWVTYAAAACLLLAVSVYLFERSSSAQQLAANYVTTTYSQLGQIMGPRTTMATGIEAYNNKDYNKASQVFEEVAKNDTANSYAIQYAGLAYLQVKNYDGALAKFDALSRMSLFSNPGDFLKAVTLLERNQAGDKDEAKLLLQKVVNGNEDGSEEAKEWLKKL